jgi:hypothetical protein
VICRKLRSPTAVTSFGGVRDVNIPATTTAHQRSNPDEGLTPLLLNFDGHGRSLVPVVQSAGFPSVVQPLRTGSASGQRITGRLPAVAGSRVGRCWLRR